MVRSADSNIRNEARRRGLINRRQNLARENPTDENPRAPAQDVEGSLAAASSSNQNEARNSDQADLRNPNQFQPRSSNQADSRYAFSYVSWEVDGTSYSMVSWPFLPLNPVFIRSGGEAGTTEVLLLPQPCPPVQPRPEATSSANSLADRNSPGSDAQHEAGVISNEVEAASSSEPVIDSSRAERNARRNAKHKARRKAKKEEKLASGTDEDLLEKSAQATTGISVIPIVAGEDSEHGLQATGENLGEDIQSCSGNAGIEVSHGAADDLYQSQRATGSKAKEYSTDQVLGSSDKDEWRMSQAGCSPAQTKKKKKATNVTLKSKERKQAKLMVSGKSARGSLSAAAQEVTPSENSKKRPECLLLVSNDNGEPAAEAVSPENSQGKPAQSSGSENCPKNEIIHRRCTPSHLNNEQPECSASASIQNKFSAFRADSRKIAEAVSDAYRVQQMSEAIQLASGGPIADFEKIILAASPIICPSSEVRNCGTCSTDGSDGLICTHEIPQISLMRVWMWYEETGSYGLLIKSEIFGYSPRGGFQHLAFRAHFVPSLSAVQLYIIPRSQAMDNDSRVPKTCRTVEDDESGFSLDTTEADEPELVFEFFEHDPPQQRKPLLEKIKELMTSQDSSQLRFYGDGKKLGSLQLDELHPRSWYCVAWYPIYRIPCGELRASFLTYHSFCHLTRRLDSCIVSPVVGLQSYNVQRERWFQLKQFGEREVGESHTINTSEVLRERVRTLQHTASAMARAVGRKGQQEFPSRHPDYEFFLSNQR